MFNFFKKEKRVVNVAESNFEIELTASVLAYELARSDGSITQEELSFKTEISLSQIARIETGKINPTLDTIVKLANGIGVEAKVLFDF